MNYLIVIFRCKDSINSTYTWCHRVQFDSQIVQTYSQIVQIQHNEGIKSLFWTELLLPIRKNIISSHTKIYSFAQTMLRIFFSFIPFMVCLCWFVAFALQYRKNDSPKRMLTLFLAVCVVLYLCHALYLNGGLSDGMESLWALCSLSVYPLYYIYIKRNCKCHW